MLAKLILYSLLTQFNLHPLADTAVDAGTPSILEANSPVISRVLAFLDAGINTGETIKTNLRTAIIALKTKYSNLKMGVFSTT